MEKKRIAMTLMALLLGSTTVMAAGCGLHRGPEDDPTIAKLVINNYNGGYGSAWLEDDLIGIEKRFEEAYKNESFIPGTTGVDVEVYNHKNGGNGMSLEALTDDIYFNEQMKYYDAALSGKFLDITDIVTENLDKKYGEDKTILSKFSSLQKDFFTINEKIYAVPHYAGSYGISYDIDLFESKLLYYADEPTTSTGLITSKTQKKSAGLDGKYDTSDDGLPTTYDELFNLCYQMSQRGVTPFGYAGAVASGYLADFLSALCVDAAGYENAIRNFNFDGSATDLVKSLTTDDKGKITGIEYEDEVKIDNSNGYLLTKQAGKAYALSFLNQIISNGYFDTDIAGGTVSHTSGQSMYLESSLKGKPVAFYIDGIYWENEVEDAGMYSMLVSKYGAKKAAKENRRFGWMAFPKPTEDWATTGATLYDRHYSFGFINANIDENKINLAKTFLQFCYTDESLANFSLLTDTSIALNYTLTKDQLSQMSTLGRSYFELRSNPTTKVVYPYSTNEMFLNNQASLTFSESTWISNVEGKGLYRAPINAIRQDGVNAKELFDGLSRYLTKEEWDSAYGKWF